MLMQLLWRNRPAHHPLACDLRRDGSVGNTLQAVVYHGDHQIDRRFSNQIIALVHSSPVRPFGPPLVLDQTDVPRNIEA